MKIVSYMNYKDEGLNKWRLFMNKKVLLVIVLAKTTDLASQVQSPTSTHGLIGPLLMYRFMTMRAIMQAPYSPGPAISRIL